MSYWTRIWPRLRVTAISGETVEKLDAGAVSFGRITGDMFAGEQDMFLAGARQFIQWLRAAEELNRDAYDRRDRR